MVQLQMNIVYLDNGGIKDQESRIVAELAYDVVCDQSKLLDVVAIEEARLTGGESNARIEVSDWELIY